MSQRDASSTPDPPVEADVDIPVTVIGGYLGSGKTTLVNHLLATGAERMAVLVNDFGDVDIDASLIERDDGDTIALANGCICCSLVDGLAAALATINALEPRPDRLVIEASGVADPGAVAAYGHGPGLGLDAVIVLVDAETIQERAADKYVGDTVLTQLRSADIVVINKTDLVEDDDLERLRRWLETRIDRAVVVEASQARVDAAVLFGTVESSAGASRGGGAANESSEDRADRSAEVLFENWSWAGQQPVDRLAVERLMGELPDSVIRAKGILWLEEEPLRAHVLQRVGQRWSLRPVPARAAAARSAGSRLVLIGHRGAIDDRWLTDRLGP